MGLQILTWWDYYALGQCTPGIIAINVATLIGYKQRGWRGGVAATLGVVTPSLVIILILASILNTFADIPMVQHAFAGLRVGVGALILNSVIKLFKKNVKDIRSIVLFALAFICVAIIDLSPLIVVLATIVIGLALHWGSKWFTLILFFEFFKAGLFAIGGGLATLPFLSDMADKYTWFTHEILVNMVAISESTPGPLGVNMATYAGFNAGGVLGAVVAVIGLLMPSVLIVILIVAKFYTRYRENTLVQDIFGCLRPVATGLIAAAGASVIIIALFGSEFSWSAPNIDTPKLIMLIGFILILSLPKTKKFTQYC